jgi:hypothetical protein
MANAVWTQIFSYLQPDEAIRLRLLNRENRYTKPHWNVITVHSLRAVPAVFQQVHATGFVVVPENCHLPLALSSRCKQIHGNVFASALPAELESIELANGLAMILASGLLYASLRTLSLYATVWHDSTSMTQLALLCPNLEHLLLDKCMDLPPDLDLRGFANLTHCALHKCSGQNYLSGSLGRVEFGRSTQDLVLTDIFLKDGLDCPSHLRSLTLSDFTGRVNFVPSCLRSLHVAVYANRDADVQDIQLNELRKHLESHGLYELSLQLKAITPSALRFIQSQNEALRVLFVSNLQRSVTLDCLQEFPNLRSFDLSYVHSVPKVCDIVKITVHHPGYFPASVQELQHNMKLIDSDTVIDRLVLPSPVAFYYIDTLPCRVRELVLSNFGRSVDELGLPTFMREDQFFKYTVESIRINQCNARLLRKILNLDLPMLTSITVDEPVIDMITLPGGWKNLEIRAEVKLFVAGVQVVNGTWKLPKTLAATSSLPCSFERRKEDVRHASYFE